MKKILKIQALILLLLMLLAWVSKGSPDSAFMLIVTLFIAPLMFFSSHWLGIAVYSYALVIVMVTLTLMIYGYKQRDKKQGIITFSVGFWLYTFSCLLFVESQFN